MLVSDGEMNAHITTFEASKILVGCDVSKYAKEMLHVNIYTIYNYIFYFMNAYFLDNPNTV